MSSQPILSRDQWNGLLLDFPDDLVSEFFGRRRAAEIGGQDLAAHEHSLQGQRNPIRRGFFG